MSKIIDKKFKDKIESIINNNFNPIYEYVDSKRAAQQILESMEEFGYKKVINE